MLELTQVTKYGTIYAIQVYTVLVKQKYKFCPKVWLMHDRAVFEALWYNLMPFYAFKKMAFCKTFSSFAYQIQLTQ